MTGMHDTYTSAQGSINWNIDHDGEVELQIDDHDGEARYVWLTESDITRMANAIACWNLYQRTKGDKV